MRRTDDRVTVLEAKLARMERELSRLAAQRERLRIPRVGIWLGKTDEVIDKGDSGTVSLYGDTPLSEVDATQNVTAYNKFANVESGKWCIVAYIHRAFYMIAAEC